MNELLFLTKFNNLICLTTVVLNLGSTRSFPGYSRCQNYKNSAIVFGFILLITFVKIEQNRLHFHGLSQRSMAALVVSKDTAYRRSWLKFISAR